jgi:hypothetical protein
MVHKLLGELAEAMKSPNAMAQINAVRTAESLRQAEVSLPGVPAFPRQCS